MSDIKKTCKHLRNHYVVRTIKVLVDPTKSLTRTIRNLSMPSNIEVTYDQLTDRERAAVDVNQQEAFQSHPPHEVCPLCYSEAYAALTKKKKYWNERTIEIVK